jgi:maltose-binding protein MalE
MRLRRSRKGTLLAAVLGLSLIAAACGDDDDTEAAATTAPAGETTAAASDTTAAAADTTAAAADTTAAAGGDTTAPTAPARGDADLVIWADDTRKPLIEEIATTFGEENGITVAVQELEFGQIREQLSLAAPGGEGPDIVIGAHDWLGELVENGVLEPLDLGAAADGFQDVAIDAFTYEGKLYGLPYAVENIALLRNTELAPTAPTTWEELVQMATDYKAQHAGDPTSLGLALQVGPEGDAYHLQPVLSAYGGYIFAQNADGTFNPADLGVDSPGALAAATFLSDSASNGLLSADVTYDVMIDSFGSGKAPFAITGPWAVSQEDNGFKATGVPYTVSPIPGLAGGEAPKVFVGVQGFMISSFSEQKDLAKSFVLDFMSQESTQRALFEAGGRPPALISAFDQVKSDPDVAGFGESGAAGIPQPAIPEMGSVWTALGLAEVNVLKGDDPTAEFTAAAETIRGEIGG